VHGIFVPRLAEGIKRNFDLEDESLITLDSINIVEHDAAERDANWLSHSASDAARSSAAFWAAARRGRPVERTADDSLATAREKKKKKTHQNFVSFLCVLCRE
jgi:hypothetical protein